MDIRGTTMNDVAEVHRFIARNSWLDEPTVTVMLTFAGSWTRVALDGDVIVGVIVATPGIAPEESEPDSENDANFTEDGSWVDEVDSSAQVIMTPLDPPVFEPPTALVVWDVIGDGVVCGSLLRDTLNRCRVTGFDTLSWVVRPETQRWLDLMLDEVVPEYGGASMVGSATIEGLGDPGFWIGF